MKFDTCVVECQRLEGRNLNEKIIDHEGMFAVGLAPRRQQKCNPHSPGALAAVASPTPCSGVALASELAERHSAEFSYTRYLLTLQNLSLLRYSSINLNQK